LTLRQSRARVLVVAPLAIYLIESLPPGDQRTGKHLLEDALSPLCEQYDGNASYAYPQTRVHFFDLLRQIATESSEGQLAPIIQIEAHGHLSPNGGTDGLLLASGAVVSWADLGRALRAVNVASHNNVLLMLMACTSKDVIRMVDFADRAPFRGLVAALRDVTPDEVLGGMTIFYRTFLETQSHVLAAERMNEAGRPDGSPPFGYVSAEALFHTFVEKNYHRHMTARGRQNMAERLVAMRRERPAEYLRDIVGLRRDIKGFLKTATKPIVKRKFDTFLMRDLYPGDQEWFEEIWEGCWPGEDKSGDG